MMQENPVRLIRDALREFYEELVKVIRSWPIEPMAQSIADAEIAQIANFVMMAASHASLSIEDGGDHLVGLARLAEEPVSTTACFTCVRSMLESCAIGAWLVDPAVGASLRRARVYAFRRSGMVQLRKFATCTGETDRASEITSKIESLELEATASGYALNSEPENSSSPGISMPIATNMIRDVLALDSNYRMLSGIAHGHHWARQLLYTQSSETTVGGAQGVLLQKSLTTEAFMFISHSSFLSLVKVLWNRSLYMGNDTEIVEELVESFADKIQVKVADRFWRHSTT